MARLVVALDWAVVLAFLAVVTFVGVRLGGRQRGVEDFFGSGAKLPWWAISASYVATVISAVTFVGVPARAYAGNLSYLQLGIVAGLLSRLFVALVLVPAYWRHEVLSPYDYFGLRLGPGAKGVTTALFTLGGVLAQSARLYLTAVVLVTVAVPEAWAGPGALLPMLAGVTAVSVVWTMLGGIVTVVWTDVLLFGIFLLGGAAALATIVVKLPGGVAEFWTVGQAAGKFVIFDLSVAFDLTQPYTLAAAGFAVVVGNVGTYGTDQLVAQRIFACAGPRAAQKMILSSYLGEAVVLLMGLTGVGLFAYYQQFPGRLAGVDLEAVRRDADHLFPIFILRELPVGVRGLIVAALIATAIDTLTGILAALAQTTLSAVYVPLRARQLGVTAANEGELGRVAGDAEQRRMLLVSRGLIVAWGAVLAAVAAWLGHLKEATGTPILDLALGLATYAVGGLFAAFLLAWLPAKVNGRGLVFSAPLSVMAVAACSFHAPRAIALIGVGAGVIGVAWVLFAALHDPSLRLRRLARTPWLVAGIGLVVLTAWKGYFVRDGVPVNVAWPWHAPLGAGVALAIGYLLADRRPVPSPGTPGEG